MSNTPTPKTSKQLKQDMIEELSKEGFDTNILSDDSGDLGITNLEDFIDLLEDDIPSYIGQGAVSGRKGNHLHVFRYKGKAGLSEKALLLFQNSQTKSHAACKMHDYDPEIDNWYFSFCIVGNKSVASEYEDLLIKSQEPEFNNPSMSGVN